MFIQTEATPNPATLKFLPDRTILESGSANFTDVEATSSSPLAKRLFDVDGITGVFLGGDFVTVTKADDKDWQVMKPLVLEALMDFFSSGQDIIVEGAGAEADGEEDSEIVAQIKELLETRVRPAVAQDGGDIIFQGFDDGIVYLTMMGSCSGCPSSGATLKHGIENMLRYYIPEITEVREAV